jgi:hypothetical protein
MAKVDTNIKAIFYVIFDNDRGVTPDLSLSLRSMRGETERFP